MDVDQNFSFAHREISRALRTMTSVATQVAFRRIEAQRRLVQERTQQVARSNTMAPQPHLEP